MVKRKDNSFEPERKKKKLAATIALNRSQELCESRGGLPGLPVPNIPYGLCGRRRATLQEEADGLELRSCVKIEMDVLGSPPQNIELRDRTVSVDVKQH